MTFMYFTFIHFKLQISFPPFECHPRRLLEKGVTENYHKFEGHVLNQKKCHVFLAVIKIMTGSNVARRKTTVLIRTFHICSSWSQISRLPSTSHERRLRFEAVFLTWF